ncbi:MAG: AraC family transcriptional regulator [Clostridia bacterium]|nr:AraC family transcriptional regulator [Clostridia bacterium]
MAESICRFVPKRKETDEIRTVHFVYEAEHHSLTRPLVRPTYQLHLVTNGSALVRMAEKEHRLSVGDLFFSFAGVPFDTVEEENLKYFYIGFTGKGATALLEDLGVSVFAPVYRGFHHLQELWFSALSRANDDNAGLLSEGVLRYTLSFLTAERNVEKEENATAAELLLDYANNHFAEEDLSLTRVAELFFYTEKYVSHLFKKQAGVGFSQYVADLRLAHAERLLSREEKSVAEIAHACGYRDALYFSKVFKKRTGKTPKEYMTYIKNKGE